MDLSANLIKSIIESATFLIANTKETTNSPGAHSKVKGDQININNLYMIAGNDVIKNSDAVDLTPPRNPAFKKGYQAVFLTNGQVYFGKLELVDSLKPDDKFIKLRQVFYLSDLPGPDNHALIKLGQELHMPLDEMNINVDQILFWEKLEDNSQIVKSIQQYYQRTNTRKPEY